MDIKEVYGIILDKLNKLSTNFKQMATPVAVMRAVNQAQYYWLDERLRQEEYTKQIQQELQQLITEVDLPKGGNPIEFTLPDNYYHYSNIDMRGKVGNCEMGVVVELIENSNVNKYLNDENTKPDFQWEQALATVRNNKLILYVGDGTVTSATFHYYRKPIEVDMATDYKNLDGTPTADIDLEFNGSSAYEIIDLAVLILTGNVNDAPGVNFQSSLISKYK